MSEMTPFDLLSDAQFEIGGEDQLTNLRSKHSEAPADAESTRRLETDWARLIADMHIRTGTLLKMDTDGNTTEVTRSFYHRNALGSVMEITDMNQAVVVSYRYDPYGKVTITRGGTPQSSDPLGNHWTFTGRFLDEEAGLLYYRARYYDPATGRFLQRDPLGYDPGPMVYEYAGSSPIGRTDPSGMDWIDDLITEYCTFTETKEDKCPGTTWRQIDVDCVILHWAGLPAKDQQKFKDRVVLEASWDLTPTCPKQCIRDGKFTITEKKGGPAYAMAHLTYWKRVSIECIKQDVIVANVRPAGHALLDWSPSLGRRTIAGMVARSHFERPWRPIRR